MRTSIELPDVIYREGKRLARAKGYTLEQFIVSVLERELFQKTPFSHSRNRVSLPLIHSQNPGTLDLANFDLDDLLT